MNKNILFTGSFLLLFIFLYSCSNRSEFKYRTVACTGDSLARFSRTEQIIENPVTGKYFPVWKSLIMEQNHLSEDFFKRHIQVFFLDTIIYNHTTLLAVGYEYKTDWAATNVYNEIIIRINDQASPFHGNGLPVNEDLTKDQIISLSSIRNNSMGNRLYKISSQTNLKYTFATARETLRTKLNISKLCNANCGLNSEGHITLRYSDSYVDDKQYCSQAELDLVTGKMEASVSECVID